MHFRRVYWLVVIVLSLSGATISVWGELYTIWRSQYALLFLERNTKNLIETSAEGFKNKIVRFFTGDDRVGLPVIRMYVPEKAQANLMSRLPDNVKKWQRGAFVYPDGKIRKVKVRHRGDNPVNWAYEKKSWRIKTTKKRLIDRVRRFNYIVPQTKELLAYLLPYEVHRRMGMPTPDVRLVELFINDKSNGIYQEVEQLGESFLRRRNIMPVNLYKGEQKSNEHQLMIEPNLYDNPRLWKKIATFNQLPKKDFSDLENFLRLLKDASTSPDAFARLTEIAKFRDWARFSAFQTLTQAWTNDDTHNARLVGDPWKGSIFLLPHDEKSAIGQAGKFTIDRAENALQRLYNGSSRFLFTKHKILKKFVDENLLVKLADDLGKMLDALKISASRDPALLSQATSQNNSTKTTDEQLIEALPVLNEYLRRALYAEPSVTWSQQGKELKIVVAGFTPSGKLMLELESSSEPGTIAWDADQNGRLSKGDMPLPVRMDGGRLIIDAIWYANRGIDGQPRPTAFNLVSDREINVRRIRAANPFTEKFYNTRRGQQYGATPTRLNKPLIKAAAPVPVILEGQIGIRSTRIFNAPVIIRQGTVLKMHPGASLVFRNVVTVNGTAEKPIQVRGAEREKPWGVFAIYGAKTAGSRIRHLQLEGGSGEIVNGVHFIAMLSVHDTSDIEFDAITLRNNKAFDDAMHVVYSKNIRLKNSVIENAFSDALDVDISSIEITGTVISGAGNDAIDLMSSKALIQTSRLIGARDKGVSVGEASTALVVNSLIKDNVIGLESKDGSDSYILNSDLLGNKTQINAYQKNWRYNDGGSVVVNKVVMRGGRNAIVAGKRSRILVSDSTLFPRPLAKGRRIALGDDNSFETGVRTAVRPYYAKGIKSVMRQFGVSADPLVRGMQP